MKKIVYTEGQIVNKYNITYVSETKSFIESNNRKRSASIFKCHCGKDFISRNSDVIYNKRTSCGCKKGSKPNFYKQGDLINGIKFIKTCGTYKYQQKAIFECPLCNKNWKSLVGNIQQGNIKSCCGIKRGWSKSQWIKISKTAKLYKVKMYNEFESFIKIGITTQSIKKRFISCPYKFEIIKIIEGDSGYIFDLEIKTKKIFKNYKYIPLLKFKGETECYKLK